MNLLILILYNLFSFIMLFITIGVSFAIIISASSDSNEVYEAGLKEVALIFALTLFVFLVLS